MIGRFAGVDPIAAQFPHVSVFNYAENEPVGHIDLWGLQKYKPKLQEIKEPSDLLSLKMLNNVYEGGKTMFIEFGSLIDKGVKGIGAFFSPGQEQEHDVAGGVGLTRYKGTAKGMEKRINADAETANMDGVGEAMGGGAGVGKKLTPLLRELNHFLDLGTDMTSMLGNDQIGEGEIESSFINDTFKKGSAGTVDTIETDDGKTYKRTIIRNDDTQVTNYKPIEKKKNE